MANVNLMLGKTYSEFGNFNQCLSHFLTAAEYAEKSGDAKTIGTAQVHIGQYYQGHEMGEKAIPYMLRAIKLFIEIGDSSKLMEATAELGITQKELHQFDEAEKNLRAALNFSLAHNKIMMQHFSRGQLALVKSLQGRHEEAIELLKQGYENAQQTNDIADHYWMLGNEYLALKDYKQAVIEYNKGLPVALENDIAQVTADFYDMLSFAHAGLKEYNTAYDYARQSMLMKDTIYDLARQDEMIQMQEQFESNKKDKEITLLNTDKKLKAEEASHQKLIKNIFIAGLVITLLFVFVLLNRYKIKQRTTKQLEEKNILIEKEKERAEQSERFKSQFLANMSHEIRTPMNAVIGMTYLMEDTRLDEKQRRYLNAIKNSSENLLVIINDVLDLSKLEAGKMELEKTPFRLDDVLNTVHDTLRFKAEEKGLHFNIQKSETIHPYLKGDPTRLSQVLLNLTGNAIKFTDKGAVTINVEHLPSNSENGKCKLRFIVSDTGIGIPEEKRVAVFESFKQASEGTSRKYGGTGLGLSISQQIMQLHNSRITVESNAEGGSVFTFDLIYDLADEAEFESVNYKPLAENFDELKGIRILLAEDNEYNQEVAVLSLHRMVNDLKIDIAGDGTEAIELLKNNIYDVILMDVQMPGMDGYEATRCIRNDFDDDKRNTPIIALTASATREEINAGFDAGMNAYVAKPFKPADLLIKIASQLKKQTSPRNGSTKIKSANGELFDFTLLEEISGGDKTQMKKLISRFITDSQKSFEKIESLIQAENFTEAKKQIHILRPQVETMGIKSLAELLHTTEQNSSNYDLMTSQLKTGKKICMEAVEELKKHIES